MIVFEVDFIPAVFLKYIFFLFYNVSVSVQIIFLLIPFLVMINGSPLFFQLSVEREYYVR